LITDNSNQQSGVSRPLFNFLLKTNNQQLTTSSAFFRRTIFLLNCTGLGLVKRKQTV
jgi:hypothetical protein